MQVPEEFRCCVCLSVPDRALLTGCPHRVCLSCAESGSMAACPVCRAALPAERPLDEAFAVRVAAAVLRCDCGSDVEVRQAETHVCEALNKKRKSPEVSSPLPPSGRRPPAVPNRSTFACPLCEERNLTSQGLMEHCERAHVGNGRGPVAAVCPICLAMPWGDPSYVSRDFLSHLRLRHRCDYTTLTDFEADEEAMLQRAMRESLRSAGLAEAVEEEERILAEVLRASAQEARGSNPAAADEDAEDGSSDSGASVDARALPPPAQPDGPEAGSHEVSGLISHTNAGTGGTSWSTTSQPQSQSTGPSSHMSEALQMAVAAARAAA